MENNWPESLEPTRKEGREYPFYGYAPGNYAVRCHDCQKMVMADKRAWRCEPCAEKFEAVEKATPSPSPDTTFQESIDNMDADSKIFVDKSLAIAHRIKQCMEAKGWMQKDLAEKLGKTHAEISKWLAGMHNFTLRTIAKLEAALECEIISVTKSSSPSPDREVGGDGFLEWLDEETIAAKKNNMTGVGYWLGYEHCITHAKEKYLSLQSPSLPADKPVTLPYVKATDRLPEDGQQVFFRLKRPNEPAKYLGGFFKKDNRPDKTNGGDLSGFTDDRNLYALSININYIDWVDEYSLADKFPSLPIEDKQIHVNLPSGGVARVDENASAELLGALDKMVQLAKENVPIEEGADLKRIESDAISNLPEYLKDGRDKGRFAWEEGYRAGATNEGSSLRTQLQSLISDNDSLRKEAQQLQQDNEDDAHRAHVTIQSLTEERDALKTTLAEQKVEREKLRQERNDYRRILDSIEKDNDEESRILSQPNMEIIHELLKQYPSQQ